MRGRSDMGALRCAGGCVSTAFHTARMRQSKLSRCCTSSTCRMHCPHPRVRREQTGTDNVHNHGLVWGEGGIFVGEKVAVVSVGSSTNPPAPERTCLHLGLFEECLIPTPTLRHRRVPRSKFQMPHISSPLTLASMDAPIRTLAKLGYLARILRYPTKFRQL